VSQRSGSPSGGSDEVAAAQGERNDPSASGTFCQVLFDSIPLSGGQTKIDVCS
jgi:hypothetical protein